MKAIKSPAVRKSFAVLNLSCASCAVSAESTIASLPGVLESSVNFASGQLSVTYLSTLTDPLAFKKALQAIGYDLLIETEEVDDTLALIREKKFIALKRKTTWAVLLCFPLVVIGMFFMDIPYANTWMALLASPVVLWIGKDFYVSAWQQARHGMVGMNTLVALSTGIAYLFSLFTLFFPVFWHRNGLHAHVYFEAAAVVIAFVLLGKLLEESAKSQTSSAIKKLIGSQPKIVSVVVDGREKQIPIAEIRIGDVIRVKPGDKIAVDGCVLQGTSYVDESLLTGEPVPVLKIPEADVFAGTVNQKGSFDFSATKVGGETLFAQIIKTVELAQGSKAPVQKLVDKIAAVFVPVIIGISIFTFLLWSLFSGENGIISGLLAAITVLVIACPCALGLATPTAIMVGIGKAATAGILIKDAESLERLKKIDVVVLDKTGTLTAGKPRVTDVRWLRGDSSKKGILAAMEGQSEHPLASAVITHFSGVSIQLPEYFESLTGKGIKAKFDGDNYLVGNRSLLDEYGISISEELDQAAQNWSLAAKTLVWFADGKDALAVIAISDELKDSSVTAIRELQKRHIELYMLTGDADAVAKAIALQTGIQNYRSEMSPADKAEFIDQLRQRGRVVAMVGDGINDSAALATADVSIAMGKGSDIAMDVANMTIISSDLTKISTAIRLSEQTVATVRENLFWAFIYNLIGIPLAAGVLYPINGFLLDPMIAGAAMALSSVSVVANSLRLKFKK